MKYIITLLILSSQLYALEQHNPLIAYCLRDNNLDRIRQEIEVNNADINQECGYLTPLIAAVQKGNTDTIQYLLEKGANLHTFLNKETEYSTAFAYATEKYRLDIMALLVKHGADVKKENKIGFLMHTLCVRFCTPLDPAQQEIPRENTSPIFNIIEQLCVWDVNLTHKDMFHHTPLYYLTQKSPTSDAILRIIALFQQKTSP